MRISKEYNINHIPDIKNRLFEWSKQFKTSILLDSNNYTRSYDSFDFCLAVISHTEIKVGCKDAFKGLEQYKRDTEDYIFGYMSYDLKNDIEKLESKNHDALGFHDMYFFQPQKIIFIKNNVLEFSYLKIVSNEIKDDFKEINKVKNKQQESVVKNNFNILPRISKTEYFSKVDKILNHIQQGDIYEATFCQEFYAENAVIDPYQAYLNLNEISKPPFSSYMRIGDHYIISASPERYIRKQNEKVISQPIKGTTKRSKDGLKDKQNADILKANKKELSENIMIVDLVRNDLSKSAKKGSVKVEELCELYSFEQVHQLISTIVSQVDSETNPVNVIRDTFPMGSMTGAPKITAMKIIEELESSKRGVYSGALGYFTPNDNFDFNVVIRTILYNSSKNYVSYTVGGAITSKSSPMAEYDECLLKANAMKKVLTNKVSV